MDLLMPCDCGKEVVTMDDADVHVAPGSVGNPSIPQERMG